jgi:hypothetical protein
VVPRTGLNNAQRKILPLRGLELRLPGRRTTSDSLYRLRYPGPKLSICFPIFPLWTDTVRTVVFCLEYQPKDKVQRPNFAIQLANLDDAEEHNSLLLNFEANCYILLKTR